MAPAVIYIDEVEKVFCSDKKKAREWGGQVRLRARVCVCLRVSRRSLERTAAR
jgi:hypothetical protein